MKTFYIGLDKITDNFVFDEHNVMLLFIHKIYVNERNKYKFKIQY